MQGRHLGIALTTLAVVAATATAVFAEGAAAPSKAVARAAPATAGHPGMTMMLRNGATMALPIGSAAAAMSATAKPAPGPTAGAANRLGCTNTATGLQRVSATLSSTQGPPSARPSSGAPLARAHAVANSKANAPSGC